MWRSAVRARAAVLVACAAGATLVTGCTSSAAPSDQGPPGGSDSTSSAATSSAATSSAATSSAPSSSAAGSSAPALSKFESDPAIVAYRAWAAQAGRTVNSGHYTSVKLEQLMTPTFAKRMKHLLGTEVGRYYPGPIPFTPVSLVNPSAATRRSDGCLISAGFAENPKTHKPAVGRKVLPVEIDFVYQSGQWLLNALNDAPSTSCTGVQIGAPRW